MLTGFTTGQRRFITVQLMRLMVTYCQCINHNYRCLFSAGLSGLAKELLSDFADSLPGIDEAKSFMQVMS